MSKHVLVVDDDEQILKFVKVFLESEGYRVTTAKSGNQALEFLEKEYPDLMVLDIMMPEMSGFDVLDVIRELEPADTTLPVILLTALNDNVTAWKGWTYGIGMFMPKPFNPDHLSYWIDAILSPEASSMLGDEEEEKEERIWPLD